MVEYVSEAERNCDLESADVSRKLCNLRRYPSLSGMVIVPSLGKGRSEAMRR